MHDRAKGRGSFGRMLHEDFKTSTSTQAARNDKVWNGKSVNPGNIVESTKRYLADWKSIVGGVDDDNPNSRNKPDQRWEKPLPGYLKLNTYASVDPQSNITGYGWMLRNDAGQFVVVASIPGRGTFTPREAEAIAIREALT
nr:uncharacterized protein LOC109154289 [Ipomoea batatas]